MEGDRSDGGQEGWRVVWGPGLEHPRTVEDVDPGRDGTPPEVHVVRRVGARTPAPATGGEEVRDCRSGEDHPSSSSDVVIAQTLACQVAVLLTCNTQSTLGTASHQLPSRKESSGS